MVTRDVARLTEHHIGSGVYLCITYQVGVRLVRHRYSICTQAEPILRPRIMLWLGRYNHSGILRNPAVNTGQAWYTSAVAATQHTPLVIPLLQINVTHLRRSLRCLTTHSGD